MSDRELVDMMESVFTGAERWMDLIGVIRRRVELVDDAGERETLFAQMAELARV